MTHDRPTLDELLEAVSEFLRDEVVPALDDRGVRYRTLVAVNLLAIARRELAADGESAEAWRRLAAVDGGPAAGSSADFRARLAALNARIRLGEADDGPWADQVWALARWLVERKLEVANPRRRGERAG